VGVINHSYIHTIVDSNAYKKLTETYNSYCKPVVKLNNVVLCWEVLCTLGQMFTECSLDVHTHELDAVSHNLCTPFDEQADAFCLSEGNDRQTDGQIEQP
jgi:hypothetical protein